MNTLKGCDLLHTHNILTLRKKSDITGKIIPINYKYVFLCSGNAG